METNCFFKKARNNWKIAKKHKNKVWQKDRRQLPELAYRGQHVWLILECDQAQNDPQHLVRHETTLVYTKVLAIKPYFDCSHVYANTCISEPVGECEVGSQGWEFWRG